MITVVHTPVRVPSPVHPPTVVGGGTWTEFTATINNAGTAPSPPTIEVDGPVGTGVILRNSTSGEQLVLAVSAESGETLTVNFGSRQVDRDGTVLSGAVTPGSKWWKLATGNNSVVTSAVATVKWRDAYL